MGENVPAEKGRVEWRGLAETPWTRQEALSDSTTGASAGLGADERRPLTRSRSTLDLYQVGVRRPSLSVRQYGTDASPVISELDIDEYYHPAASRTTSLPPVQRKLSQPNRVLMDLAGLDIPSRSTRSRGLATSAQAQATTDESVDYTPSAGETGDNEMDLRIYTAIQHAVQTGRKDLVKELIEYYRSPRDSPPTDSALHSHLPLPAGYTVNTYNACIKALVTLRSSGESIAPILELYNEMLARDVVPNGKTYADVICALCARDKDVFAAVAQRREEKKWNDVRHRNLGLKSDPTRSETDHETEQSAVLAGYVSEGNTKSAFRLFKGIASVQSQTNRFYRFYPVVYSYLLDAISVQLRPSTKRAMEVFDHANETETAGRRMLYKHLFRTFAGAGDKEGLLGLWDRFEKERAEGLGTKLREWKDVLPGVELEDREIQVEKFQAEVCASAVVALIQVGAVDKAVEVLEMMMARVGTSEKSHILLEPPRITPEVFGAAVIALAERGEYDLSKKWFDRARECGQTLRPIDIARYIDALVVGAQWRLALDVYMPIVADTPEGMRVDHTRVKRIYGSILGDARQLTAQNDIDATLAHADKLMASAGSGIAVEPELVVQHVELLLRSSPPRYTAIAQVLDNFGPLMSRYRVEKEDRKALHYLLSEVASTDIPLVEMLDVLRAFARQRVQPTTDRPYLLSSVVSKYTSLRSTDADALKQITADGWLRLTIVLAHTAGRAFEEGEYDTALEALMDDLKAYAPETLRDESKSRVVRALAEGLFNRFGSERSSAMLHPLLGEEVTSTVLASFFEQPGSSALSTPELVSSDSDLTSSSSAAPLTPEEPPVQPSQPRRTSSSTSTARIRINSDLTRMVDGAFDRNPQVTPLAAYAEIRNALPKGNAPHPGSIARLMIAFARDGATAEPRVLELYQLAQTVIAAAPQHHQPQLWRLIEEGMLISQCHLGHLEQAGLHRHRLVENGTPPSADAYATMIASSKDTTDDALVARELFDESQAMGVRPNLYLYNTVISKLSKARKAEEALEMFAQMKAQRVKPSSVTYGAVIVSPSQLMHITPHMRVPGILANGSERVLPCRRRRVGRDSLPGNVVSAKLPTPRPAFQVSPLLVTS